MHKIHFTWITCTYSLLNTEITTILSTCGWSRTGFHPGFPRDAPRNCSKFLYTTKLGVCHAPKLGVCCAPKLGVCHAPKLIRRMLRS